jgi:SAM-dependent methyltransferase
MLAWFENDEFWRDGYEVMFSEDAFQRAAGEIDRVLTLGQVEPRHVLDLCCGPGRHTIPLAQRGVAVAAVDLSSFLLDKARVRARAAGVQPEFIKADMRSFVRPGAFDLVLNLYTSFGYFERREDDQRVLRNVYESLRPGGALLLDVIGKELQSRRGDRVTDLSSGATCIQRIHVVDDWSTLQSEWLIVSGTSVRRHPFTHRLYSGFELRQLMETCGFEVSLFGDFDGRDYGLQATRLIARGRKPSSS